MQLSANELAFSMFAINSFACSKEEQSIAKSLIETMTSKAEGEGDQKHFVDCELEVPTLQKAYLMKVLDAGKWTPVQWEHVVTPLVEKLK